MAMQGLAVVPLFAGFDLETGSGRIFSYDVTGGRYEEHALPLGRLRLDVRPRLAEEALPRRPRPRPTPSPSCVEALYDAADDDSATGGPDLTRRIFPVVAVVTADGFRRLPDDEVGAVVEHRRRRPARPARRPDRAAQRLTRSDRPPDTRPDPKTRTRRCRCRSTSRPSRS